MSKKILIVDDDRDIRKGLEARLRAAGYDTIAAEDGLGATTKAIKEKPDLILLDLGLPGGDGYAVLDRLRKNSDLESTPVIVLTARAPAGNEQRAIDAGAFAFFLKPADNEALLSSIARAVSGKLPS